MRRKNYPSKTNDDSYKKRETGFEHGVMSINMFYNETLIELIILLTSFNALFVV